MAEETRFEERPEPEYSWLWFGNGGMAQLFRKTDGIIIDGEEWSEMAFQITERTKKIHKLNEDVLIKKFKKEWIIKLSDDPGMGNIFVILTDLDGNPTNMSNYYKTLLDEIEKYKIKLSRADKEIYKLNQELNEKLDNAVEQARKYFEIKKYDKKLFDSGTMVKTQKVIKDSEDLEQE